ncbi:bifunctional 4-hydroxy-2-oxoglutarate aldolase/2-dehydro-3-deoxy-phosphogluconate aldolase [Kribbella sp. CA-245084]|uniref:bifunctional 4-hydroxy-2-oxoglutarate aldolase/2-dehydro-3-deoxy-phosphogluconate aldolase n=1 Tax=Kribbella sp. CA-245084 TaxID=3239940 RepID=UPI003D94A71F
MAIIRGDSPEQTLRCIEVLLEGGLSVVEISLTGSGALEALQSACKEFGSAAMIGAGTVLTDADASAVVDAGAQYAVTPAIAEGVNGCVRLGLPVLAGALTPTEVVAGMGLGATAAKLFPASAGGPAYLRAIRAPLPHVPFVPVGGIDISTARDYIESGAVAVGVGTPLLGDAPAGGDLTALARRVAQYRRELEPR